MKKSIGIFDDEELYLYVGNYTNGRLYLGLITKDDEDFSDITINLPDTSVAKGFAYITNDMSKELKHFLIKKNIISDTIVLMPYNMSEYSMVKYNKDKLKEYDPEGYNYFLNESMDIDL